MYDITNEDSFTQVKKIKTEIEKELNKKDVPMALVAMKTDLESQVRFCGCIIFRWNFFHGLFFLRKSVFWLKVQNFMVFRRKSKWLFVGSGSGFSLEVIWFFVANTTNFRWK